MHSLTITNLHFQTNEESEVDKINDILSTSLMAKLRRVRSVNPFHEVSYYQ